MTKTITNSFRTSIDLLGLVGEMILIKERKG